MLRIVKILKYFKTILIGHKLRVYTDHKNITCRNFNTNRVLIWILILKEYGTYIEYMKGQKNIVADAISRFPLNGNQETTQKSTYQREIVSEINDTKEIPEDNFPMN